MDKPGSVHRHCPPPSCFYGYIPGPIEATTVSAVLCAHSRSPWEPLVLGFLPIRGGRTTVTQPHVGMLTREEETDRERECFESQCGRFDDAHCVGHAPKSVVKYYFKLGKLGNIGCLVTCAIPSVRCIVPAPLEV